MAGVPLISDGEVKEFLQRRALARLRGDFEEADDIREELLWKGVVTEDDKDKQDSLQWRRMPIVMQAYVGGKGCLSWIRKREEFCGQPVEDASRSYFCSEHKKIHGKRVPCPQDPKHSISIAKLAGHLRVCQGAVFQTTVDAVCVPCDGQDASSEGSAPDAAAPQVVPRPPIPVGTKETELLQLAGLASRVLNALWNCGAVVEKQDTSEDPASVDLEFDISTIVDVVMEGCAAEEFSEAKWRGRCLRLRPRPYEVLLPDCCKTLVSAAPPASNRKARNAYHDVLQQSSIAGHLDRAGWVPIAKQDEASPSTESPRSETDKLCLVEFGAGSAHLSHLIATVSKEPISFHLLVDRQANRRSADKRIRQGFSIKWAKTKLDCNCNDGDMVGNDVLEDDLPKASVHRIQCDICNLDLRVALSDTLIASSVSVVAVGKHICGAASDLSLHCCVEAAKAGVSKPVSVEGLAFALCCHHVCEWSKYVGREWLVEHGLNEEDFNSMRWFSKYAHTQYRQRSSHDVEDKLNKPWQSQSSDVSDRGNSVGARAAAARAELGHLCKRLIDEGRLAFLVREGWDCRLVRFVDRETSPENVLLLAWPRRV